MNSPGDTGSLPAMNEPAPSTPRSPELRPGPGGRSTLRLKRSVAALLLAACLSLLPASEVRADGAWVMEILDDRGRVVAVVPRQHTSISMKQEKVALVPYFDSTVSKKHPLLLVNVRYTFNNPGAATTLPVGFPELRSRVIQEEYGRDGAPTPPDTPCGTKFVDEDTSSKLTITCPETILTFLAEVEGKSVAVKALPGKKEYRRWFVFDASFDAAKPRKIRNLYTARLGYREHTSNTSSEFQYRAKYILHTGSSWSGSIGKGEVGLWRQGSWHVLKRFESLRPKKKDDIDVALHLTAERSLGRPLIDHNYGNGQQTESVLPHFEPSSVVNESSRLDKKGALHLGAMVVDQDPDSAWIDGGKGGGVSQWVQLPTSKIGRIRGLWIRAGKTRPGVSRVKRLELGCHDLQGNQQKTKLLERTTVVLKDRAERQRVLLPWPLGSCYAVRLTIKELHGPPVNHGTIAEVSFVH